MEQVIPYLSKKLLPDFAKCLDWNPLVAIINDHLGLQASQNTCRSELLRSLPVKDQEDWLDNNREKLIEEVQKAGRTRWGNFWDTSARAPYRNSVEVVADAIGILNVAHETTEKVEANLVLELSRRILATLTPEQKEVWLAKVREEAAKYGISIGVEAAGLAAIGLAQLSGFGIYLAASTALGAINSALGLGLGFGAFIGMAKAMALIIGPFGGAIFIVPLVWKAAHADPKKLLLIVAFIAQSRNAPPTRLARACAQNSADAVAEMIGELTFRHGVDAFEEILEEQPETRRTNAYWLAVTMVLAIQGRDVSHPLPTLFGGITGSEQSLRRAELLIESVSRLAGDSLDGLLSALLEVDPTLLRVCYLAAPEGSESEYTCVMNTAIGIASLVAQ